MRLKARLRRRHPARAHRRRRPATGSCAATSMIFAAADVSHRDGVVEEHRARVVHPDERRLETGLREDHHLRLDRHVQRVEHRPQVAGGLVELQRRRPACEPGVERRHGVRRRASRIADGRVIARLHVSVAPLGDGQQAATEDDGHDEQETRRNPGWRATAEGYDGNRSTASASRGYDGGSRR